jgi:hypothetical protein
MGRPPKYRPEPAFSTQADEPTDAASEARFPVRLLRNYRPSDENFTVLAPEDPEDSYSPEVEHQPTDKQRKKVWAETKIMVRKSEALTMIRKKIAERADEIA